MAPWEPATDKASVPVRRSMTEYAAMGGVVEDEILNADISVNGIHEYM